MRAISIQQPWASAIMHMGKDVENRGRGPWSSLAIGERYAIHAGLKIDPAGFDALRRLGIEPPRREAFPLGYLLGTVEHAALVRFGAERVNGLPIVTASRDVRWDGPDAVAAVALESKWRAKDALNLLCPRTPLALEKPIACKGALGLWKVPAEHLAALEALTTREA